MITVWVGDNEHTFTYVDEAFNFIVKCLQHNIPLWAIDWSCIDSEDNEELIRRVDKLKK